MSSFCEGPSLEYKVKVSEKLRIQKTKTKYSCILGQLFTLGNPEDVPADDFVSDQDVVRHFH